MADVFVSYARPDEPQARRVAEALRAEGYQVWRDDELPAHRSYAEVIEERLSAPKQSWRCGLRKPQIAMGSRRSGCGPRTGTLVQASVDGTMPPMPFNQIQCADLNGLGGGADAAGWQSSWPASRHSPEQSPSEAAPAPRAARRSVSICVLPFANMSGDAEQEYFSDGISEDITTDLSKVSALAVTARNTAFKFKGQSVDVCEVARSWASAMSSKAACARQATGSGSLPS